MNSDKHMFVIDLTDVIRSEDQSFQKKKNKTLAVSIVANILAKTCKTNNGKSISETIIEESDKLLNYLELES